MREGGREGEREREGGGGAAKHEPVRFLAAAAAAALVTRSGATGMTAGHVFIILTAAASAVSSAEVKGRASADWCGAEPSCRATRLAAAPGPAWIMVQGGSDQRLCMFQKAESSSLKGSTGVAVASHFFCFPGIRIPSGKHGGMYSLRIFLITALCFVGFG